ncbi:MAG TPA: hypothetical protein PLL48_06585 [Novosphingobium sp.]|nr:hypothetical protein [Novosphingobium sp.]
MIELISQEMVELGALMRIGERRYARYHLTIATRKDRDDTGRYRNEAS